MTKNNLDLLWWLFFALCFRLFFLLLCNWKGCCFTKSILFASLIFSFTFLCDGNEGERKLLEYFIAGQTWEVKQYQNDVPLFFLIYPIQGITKSNLNSKYLPCTKQINLFSIRFVTWDMNSTVIDFKVMWHNIHHSIFPMIVSINRPSSLTKIITPTYLLSWHHFVLRC